MTTICNDFDSILEKYNKAKLNTYKVLELLGSDYTFTNYGADVVDKRYNEILNCGTVLTFTEEIKDKKSIYHLTGANFCRQRICPMCQFRKSEKTFAEMLKVVEYLEERNYRFLHLVLTIPNCKNGEELINGIKLLYKSFGKFIRNKQVKRAYKGILRCLEISYNYDTDEFHPHLHCLVVVNSSYFNDTKVYLSYDKITEIWTNSVGLGLPYPLQCSIRAMKKGDRSGVAEVCKYCVKPLDLGERSLERDIQNINVLLTLGHTLKGTRFLQKYGVVKEAYNILFKCDSSEYFEEVNANEHKTTYFWNSQTLRFCR